MGLKVLYLDDEPTLCEYFKQLVSEPEVEVVTFTDASEAIEWARQSPPDLAIIDYRLPGTNGDRVAQAMPSGIPKYLVTGDLQVAPDYPFEEIFLKPAYLADVRRVIAARRVG